MFEYLVGVLYGFASLSDHFFVFFGAHLILYYVTSGLAYVVNLRRCFPKLVVMALSWWRNGRPSYSSPGMWLASLRMRSVGSLSGLDSSASRGQ